VKVVADSHALVWFAQGSPRLSAAAAEALRDAEASDRVVVSTATLIDLWYVTQTSQSVRAEQLAEIRGLIETSPAIELYPMNLAVTDAYTSIDRGLLKDPWDRFIVATAQTLHVPLVTKDAPIQRSGLIETIW
jgi:PIN domain nuclease of toxin-antitoxin system